MLACPPTLLFVALKRNHTCIYLGLSLLEIVIKMIMIQVILYDDDKNRKECKSIAINKRSL